MQELISPIALAVATIWGEAEGEPYEGKLGVARVIRERMKHRYFSDGTVAGTVLRPMQFSLWNTTERRRIKAAVADTTDRMVQDSMQAWRDSGLIQDPRWAGVVLYHAKSVLPSWAAKVQLQFVIGQHLFYKEPSLRG